MLLPWAGPFPVRLLRRPQHQEPVPGVVVGDPLEAVEVEAVVVAGDPKARQARMGSASRRMWPVAIG